MAAASHEVELSPLEAEMERLRLLELQKTAFHEAGHAVIACALGRPPLWMRMGSQEHACALGETKCPGMTNQMQPEKNTEQTILQACAYNVAGYLAETKFLRDAGEPIDHAAIRRGARMDMRKIDRVFQTLKLDGRGVCFGLGLNADEWGAGWQQRLSERRRWVIEDWEQRRDAALAQAVPAAEQLLSENWHRVETVAAMLLRFGKLSQSQIEAAFNAGEVQQ